MLDLHIWLLYAATVIGLMITPGPGHLLMLSNSISHGFRRSLATAAGDLSANALQMLAAGLGVAALVAAFPQALIVIKIFGVIYLIWLGVRKFRQSARMDAGLVEGASSVSLFSLWLQGFITSCVNPKAVVFFAALFPQFIQPAAFWTQFLVLSVTYICIDGFFLCTYGLAAQWSITRLRGGAKAHSERAGGVFMIAAAVVIGLKGVPGG